MVQSDLWATERNDILAYANEPSFGADAAATIDGSAQVVASAGRGYEFDSVAEIDAAISRWEQEKTEVMVDGKQISDAMATISAPAGDPSSHSQAKAAVESLNELQRHNANMLQYVEGFIENLRDARKQYLLSEVEHEAVMSLVDGG